jgi:hypothetical protein
VKYRVWYWDNTASNGAGAWAEETGSSGGAYYTMKQGHMINGNYYFGQNSDIASPVDSGSNSPSSFSSSKLGAWAGYAQNPFVEHGNAWQGRTGAGQGRQQRTLWQMAG